MMYNLLMMKKLLKLISRNPLIFLVVCGIVFVLALSSFKSIFTKPKHIYVTVKVSQGLWWANTARPNIWMVEHLTKGLTETGVLGRPTAEIVSVTYYPWFEQPASQYDTYVTLKLKVEGSKKSGYQYNRNVVSIGSAMNFEFPTISLSGTVIEMSDTPIKHKYVEKIITISKGYVLDWEYDDIMVGDKYFNGEDFVFEILKKESVDEASNILNFDSTYTGSAVGVMSFPQSRKRINLTARVRVKEIDGYNVFGEEQVISTGKDFFLSLPSVILNNYRITSIK